MNVFDVTGHDELMWSLRAMGFMLTVTMFSCLFLVIKAYNDCKRDVKLNKKKEELRDARTRSATDRLASRDNQDPCRGSSNNVYDGDFSSRHPLLAPAVDGHSTPRKAERPSR